MLSVRLNEEMQSKLDNLAAITKRPKSFFVKDALASYLDDMNDFVEAEQRQGDKNRNLISLEELEKSLNL
ncbi:RelB/StbD replicon stabilization protein (antitoxin to RelE/StbE) [uncultured Candidatus Thioglobus sp.]|nr:RelB/StbD replicon stabilization protein (antitoxin to RelE/StbE) [uncultured Candidatus Thioglobus sp.]